MNNHEKDDTSGTWQEIIQLDNTTVRGETLTKGKMVLAKKLPWTYPWNPAPRAVIMSSKEIMIPCPCEQITPSSESALKWVISLERLLAC